MQPQLPEFEGREVQAAVARFSGRTAQRVPAFSDGEFVYVIAKTRVNSIKHADFKAQSGANSPKMFTRIQELSTTRAVVLDEDEGEQLFEQALKAADAVFGIEGLPFGDGETDDTTADESTQA